MSAVAEPAKIARLALSESGKRFDEADPVLTFAVRAEGTFLDGWRAKGGLNLVRSRRRAMAPAKPNPEMAQAVAHASEQWEYGR